MWCFPVPWISEFPTLFFLMFGVKPTWLANSWVIVQFLLLKGASGINCVYIQKRMTGKGSSETSRKFQPENNTGLYFYGTKTKINSSPLKGNTEYIFPSKKKANTPGTATRTSNSSNPWRFTVQRKQKHDKRSCMRTTFLPCVSLAKQQKKGWKTRNRWAVKGGVKETTYTTITRLQILSKCPPWN